MSAPRRIDIDELRRLAFCGMSGNAIAAKLGFNPKNIRAAALRNDIAILPNPGGSGVREFWAVNAELAIRLRDDGWSTARIGAEIGCTKNSVISLFNRRGLCRPLVDGTRDSVFWAENDALLTELNRHGWSSARIARRIGRARKSIQQRLRTLRQRALKQFNRDFPVRLARVEFPPPGHCQWPNDHAPQHPDFAFCGEPQQLGSAYCEAHHRVAWRPAERKPWAVAEERY